MRTLIPGREEAGRLLGQRLERHANSDAVVVGIPRGGICVAATLAEHLGLPLEASLCRKIKDPADSNRTIGSVGISDVLVHDYSSTVPQDYIYHQIALLRSGMQRERNLYDTDRTPTTLRYKTVILVDDVLKSSDSVEACLLELRKEQPLKIIVAIPVVNAEAARMVRAHADDIVFLRIAAFVKSGKDHYEDFPKVSENTVRELLAAAKGPMAATVPQAL